MNSYSHFSAVIHKMNLIHFMNLFKKKQKSKYITDKIIELYVIIKYFKILQIRLCSLQLLKGMDYDRAQKCRKILLQR